MATRENKRTKLHAAFEQHFEAISRYCHRRLPTADANDATAQVFVVAWRRVEDMPDGDETLPWLYGIARNHVRTARRSAQRLTNLRAKLNGQARVMDPGPEAVIVRNDEQNQLLRALATLKAEDREILYLRSYEQLSSSEMAAVLGCSAEAAKKRSTRALQRLRVAAGLPQVQIITPSSKQMREGGGA